MRTRPVLLFAAFAGALLLSSGNANAASFDCKKAATGIEHLICNDPDLDSFDSQLEGAYLGALDRSNHPAQVKEQQLSWLKRRDACADQKCLSAAYQQQIQLLSAISDEPAICSGSTTPEIEACAAEYSRRADSALARYVAAARKRLTNEGDEAIDPQRLKKALAEFDASETVWTAYRKAECNAVYERWSDGTIRGTKYQECWQVVTKARTLAVWQIWLQYEDSTPPILVKP